MKVAQHVRESYERRPYPAAPRARRFRPAWRIPPLEWIAAMAQCSQTPQRVLVAGCGTGNEAFALRKRLPAAEIVAVDFSPRSLAIARDLQRRHGTAGTIDFRTADLVAANFRRVVPEQFDLVSCHGVLSYVPDAARALRNLARSLAAGGVLYLGVNGARHFSATWRPALQEFGCDVRAFEESRSLRQLLRLFDAIDPFADKVADAEPDYLSSDLFGACFENRSLSEWVQLAADAGLHFRGSYGAHRVLRRVLNSGLHEMLLPRDRPGAHLAVEQVAPSPFHPPVFTREPGPTPPWQNPEELLHCRLSWTGLYRLKTKAGSASQRSTIDVCLTSEATNTRADVQLPSWLVWCLRQRDHPGPIREQLGRRAQRISLASLRRHVYLLELLGAVTVQPVSSREPA